MDMEVAEKWLTHCAVVFTGLTLFGSLESVARQSLEYQQKQCEIARTF
jgi:hypothetical protein